MSQSWLKLPPYPTLVHENLSELLAVAFPVLHSVLDTKLWTHLVAEFVRNYPKTTPLFHRIPQLFVQFLEDFDDVPTPSFTAELAHYEWLELHLDLLDEDIPKEIKIL